MMTCMPGSVTLCTQSHSKSIYQKYKPDPFHHIFWKQQMDALSCQDVSGMCWQSGTLPWYGGASFWGTNLVGHLKHYVSQECWSYMYNHSAPWGTTPTASKQQLVFLLRVEADWRRLQESNCSAVNNALRPVIRTKSPQRNTTSCNMERYGRNTSEYYFLQHGEVWQKHISAD